MLIPKTLILNIIYSNWENFVNVVQRYSCMTYIGYVKKNNRFVEDNKNHIYLKLPFLNDTLKFELQQTVNQLQLPFKIVDDATPFFALTLNTTKTNTLKLCHYCAEPCILCHSKILSCLTIRPVYSISSCKLCEAEYIGASNRTFRDRFHEHQKKFFFKGDESVFFKHLVDIHNIVLDTHLLNSKISSDSIFNILINIADINDIPYEIRVYDLHNSIQYLCDSIFINYFDIVILHSSNKPILTWLLEAAEIVLNKPSLNSREDYFEAMKLIFNTQ